MMKPDQADLALRIMQCPMVKAVKEAKDSTESTQYACHEVIKAQEKDYSERKTTDPENLMRPFQFQLPEPWNGDINAPILFIGSNPGYNSEEDTIKAEILNQDNQKALQHFETRLTSELKNKDGSKAAYPDFFRDIQKVATRILGRAADPHKHCCSTEIVHCKSNGEVGVPCAAAHCIERWLKSLLNVSGAKIVVLIGGTAQYYCNKYFNSTLDFGQVQTVIIGERTLLFTSIYHNNARFKGVGEKKESALENILKELESNYPNILSTIRSLAN